MHNENIQEKKNIIRQQIKSLKKNLTVEEKKNRSNEIFSKIEQLNVFKKAKIIFTYWSLPDEVNTHESIIKWAKEKTILLPCIVEGNLILKEFKGVEYMKQGQLNIFEPAGEIFSYYSKIELAIIPGVAFDNLKNRMGRGKGYYDNFLKDKFIFKVGVCFDFQLLDKIPSTNDDIKMDLIICDSFQPDALNHPKIIC